METPGDCPVCGRIDSTQRVTAIYNESFSTTTRLQMQTTYGTDGKFHTTTRPVAVTKQTVLGNLLSPPQSRKIPLPQGERMMMVLATFLCMILFLYGRSSFIEQIYEAMGENGVWAFLGLLIAFPFLVWLLAHLVIFRGANQERRQRLLQELERCQRLRQQWEQFCYCRRCNAVYISGSIRGVPPEQMEQLYYD